MVTPGSLGLGVGNFCGLDGFYWGLLGGGYRGPGTLALTRGTLIPILGTATSYDTTRRAKIIMPSTTIHGEYISLQFSRALLGI